METNYITKKYYIYDDYEGEEYSHQYTLEITGFDGGIKYELFYSNNQDWTINLRGKLALSLIDNDNNIEISDISKLILKNKIEYCDIKMLFIIVSFMNRKDLNRYPMFGDVHFVDANNFSKL